MSDIIRMARAAYGPAYDRMAAEAGKIKEEYVAGGGSPEHVYSPERLQQLASEGAGALMQSPATMRQDGSIAGPYVPTPMALAMNMVQPQAIPAVLAATTAGINTVSSGINQDTGSGFAIGRAPSGQVVRVER